MVCVSLPTFLSPFEQAREIDACKIPTITDESLSFPELVLDKKTGMGFELEFVSAHPSTTPILKPIHRKPI